MNEEMLPEDDSLERDRDHPGGSTPEEQEREEKDKNETERVVEGEDG
jgi:hypothetical protein